MSQSIFQEEIGTEKLKTFWSEISLKICLANAWQNQDLNLGLSDLKHLYSILSHATYMNMVITVLEHLHIQEIILIFMFKGAKNGQGDFLYDVEISRKSEFVKNMLYLAFKTNGQLEFFKTS